MSQESILELTEELENALEQFKIALNNLENTIPRVCSSCQKLIQGYANIAFLRKIGVCLECKTRGTGLEKVEVA